MLGNRIEHVTGTVPPEHDIAGIVTVRDASAARKQVTADAVGEGI